MRFSRVISPPNSRFQSLRVSLVAFNLIKSAPHGRHPADKAQETYRWFTGPNTELANRLHSPASIRQGATTGLLGTYFCSAWPPQVWGLAVSRVIRQQPAASTSPAWLWGPSGAWWERRSCRASILEPCPGRRIWAAVAWCRSRGAASWFAKLCENAINKQIGQMSSWSRASSTNREEGEHSREGEGRGRGKGLCREEEIKRRPTKNTEETEARF